MAWPSDAVFDVALPAALRLDLFASAGIAVRLVSAPAHTSLAAMLAAHEADAVVAPALELLGPLHAGLDAKITAGVSGGGVRLLADRHSKVRHIEDIAHKRVGVASRSGSVRLFFSILARRKGVDPYTQVEWVEIPVDRQREALQTGAVDAVAVSDPMAFELVRSLNLVEVATNVSGGYRDRTYSVLACGGRLLAERSGKAAALTGGVLRSAAFVATNRLWTAQFAQDLAPALDEKAIGEMLRSEALGQHPVGRALIEDIAAYADELRLLGPFPFEMHADPFARSICVNPMPPSFVATPPTAAP